MYTTCLWLLNTSFNVCSHSGYIFFRWLFEHPEYDMLYTLTSEEIKHNEFIRNLNLSMNELRAVTLNMERPEITSIFDKLQMFSEKTYQAEKMVSRMIDAMHETTDLAERNKLRREAQMVLLEEQTAKEIHKRIFEHCKIHQGLQHNRETFENALHTKLSLISHSKLGAYCNANVDQDLKAFLDTQSSVLKNISNVNNMFSTFARVNDYYANDENHSLLTNTTSLSSLENVDSLLDERIANKYTSISPVIINQPVKTVDQAYNAGKYIKQPL